jgi:hypothetical protein
LQSLTWTNPHWFLGTITTAADVLTRLREATEVGEPSWARRSYPVMIVPPITHRVEVGICVGPDQVDLSESNFPTSGVFAGWKGISRQLSFAIVDFPDGA